MARRSDAPPELLALLNTPLSRFAIARYLTVIAEANGHMAKAILYFQLDEIEKATDHIKIAMNSNDELLAEIKGILGAEID